MATKVLPPEIEDDAPAVEDPIVNEGNAELADGEDPFVQPFGAVSDPFDDVINEMLGDPKRARALLMRALGVLAGASFDTGAGQAAHQRRPTGFFTQDGDPIDPGKAPPGTVMLPAEPGKPPTKKVWSKADLEALPYLGEMVTWRPSVKGVTHAGWQGLVYRTPFGKRITTPRAIQEAYENGVEELMAQEEGRTIAPKETDQAIPVLRDSNGGTVTGAFDALEATRSVNFIRTTLGLERLPFPDLDALPDLPELPDAAA